MTILKWLNNNLDKVAHFSVSGFIVLYGYILFNFVLPTTYSLIIASLVSFLVGFYKEKKDIKFDKFDIIANIIGIINAIVIILIINTNDG